MQKVIGVKFNESNKVYSFDPNGLDLGIGENVIVDSAIGLSFGTVVTNVKEIDELDLQEPLKVVVRKATEQDEKKFEELREKAKKDVVLIKDKVSKLGLEMKIASASYCFDGTKIIIEFSADDRVDFRDLLKELAASLKVRIELHQIGQRDEVKIKGGIGPCGEICCCARFLKEFEHVTVKMAKNQGLSLSPTKISGLCGRLMCCLAYENKTYEEILKKMPKVNSEIDSPKGKGVVVYNDILRERVSVKVKSGDDSFTVYDFSLLELNNNDRDADKNVKSVEKKQEIVEPVKQELKQTENKVVEAQKQENNGNNFKKKFNNKKHFNKNKHNNKKGE